MSAFVRKAFSRACFYIPFLVMPIKGVAVNSAQYTDNSDKHSDLKLKSVNNFVDSCYHTQFSCLLLLTEM